MFELPDEIVLHCLQYLDPISLTKLSLVSKTANGLSQDNSLWLSACFANQTANALIKAASIEPLLRSSRIPSSVFFKSVLSKDIETLKKYLFPEEKTKYFSLWIASYEMQFSFFNKPHSEYPWPLFLTEEMGIKKTPNASSVKRWLQVKVAISAEQFEELMNHHAISYKEAIKAEQFLFGTCCPAHPAQTIRSMAQYV